MTDIRVTTSVDQMMVAKTIEILCPHCNNRCEVRLPWNPTQQQRQEAIRDVISNHLRVCTVATAEDGIVAEIHYPRSG